LLMPYYGERPYVLWRMVQRPDVRHFSLGYNAGWFNARGEKDPLPETSCLSSSLTVFAFCSPSSNAHRQDEIHFVSWKSRGSRQTFSILSTTFAYYVIILTTASQSSRVPHRLCMYFMLISVMEKVSDIVKKRLTRSTQA